MRKIVIRISQIFGAILGLGFLFLAFKSWNDSRIIEVWEKRARDATVKAERIHDFLAQYRSDISEFPEGVTESKTEATFVDASGDSDLPRDSIVIRVFADPNGDVTKVEAQVFAPAF
jgi:hypothetical protein